jgi:hypothetical protein
MSLKQKQVNVLPNGTIEVINVDRRKHNHRPFRKYSDEELDYVSQLSVQYTIRNICKKFEERFGKHTAYMTMRRMIDEPDNYRS